MSLRRLAVLSVHTSPLAQPGAGDGGGMNVYVRALASGLARAGVECDVLTRRDHPGEPDVVEVEPGFRVVHLDAGPAEAVPKHDLVDLVDPMAEAVLARLAEGDLPYDALHANYWISGVVGHRLKHELDLPLAATFHTLARVKAEAGMDDDPDRRARVEQEIISCADLMLASTDEERDQLRSLYSAKCDRIEVVPPGVDHEVFRAGTAAERAADRTALDLDGRHALLFAGRIQPLKGADLAVRTLAALDDPDAVLLVVGGPSGGAGAAELEYLHELVSDLGLRSRVRFVPPQPHERLARFYRAVDVCLVPSRTESFGLVALEAAACGTPVVAAAVGGLCSLVHDGVTGFLVEERDPIDFAGPVSTLLRDPLLASEMGAAAEAASRRYGWSMTAGKLRRLYSDLLAREPVSCR
ncbi:MAG: glycosyltransferase [Actinobacteria bacterium]|nr:glycosyltransferase [Actinomycetota bacterium]